MATGKHTSKAKKTTIPASEREHVRLYRKVLSECGKRVTDAQAYERLLKARKAAAEHDAKEQAEAEAKKAEDERYKRERKIKTVERTFNMLSGVSDLLEQIEEGKHEHLCAETQAMFARAALASAASDLEDVLRDVGLLDDREAPYFTLEAAPA